MSGLERWTKSSALSQVDALYDEAARLRNHAPRSEQHVKWLLTTRAFLQQVFGEGSPYFQTFCTLPWHHTGSAVFGGPARPEESWDPQLGLDRLNREAYQRSLDAARGILGAARDELRSRELEAVYSGKDTGPEASAILRIINIAERKLRKVIRVPPTTEREVQDRFEDLLVGADIAYKREQERITYSSKTYTPDFTVERADLAIEIKFCNRETREKELIAEINDDVMAYRQRFGNLIFVVYDLGHIRDTDRFASQFEAEEGVVVRIIKH